MKMMTPQQKSEAAFATVFGLEPTLVVQAPGRVNLIGEHTDYNDGFVLPCAIDYQTVICASPRQDREIHVVAADYDNQRDSFSLDGAIVSHPEHMWANYVRGVILCLQARGYALAGANLAISGNVPQGSGLSSSASLEVAVGQLFKELCDLDISPAEIALNGQQAENDFVGCNCGIMDQLISAQGEAGHALLIDCRSLETRAVAMPEGLSVVIVNSNVKRGLVDSEYNTRRAQCEQAAEHFGVPKLRDLDLDAFNARITELDPVVARRARHVLTENSRTLKAAEALARGDLVHLSKLMADSHASMRDDFEITVPAIDTLVEIIKSQLGYAGGVRMTGGGFGGCVVALVPNERVSAVCQAVETRYPACTGLEPTLYICTPSSGAGRCE